MRGVLLPLLGMVVVAVSAGSVSHAPGACSRCLRLRGAGSAFMPQSQYPVQQQARRSAVDTLRPEEHKPVLKRDQSRLILSEDNQVQGSENATMGERKMSFLIDGKEVTEEEYAQRIKGVQHRSMEDWIAQSDTGGLKEGDVVVPDHFSSIPEAIAAVGYNQTVYIRRGYYTWDGVLVVQKHMHLRGEPNPDEGIPGGNGRPTLEGQWLLGERSSGSFKHVNCIARFDKQGRPEKHGPPPELQDMQKK